MFKEGTEIEEKRKRTELYEGVVDKEASDGVASDGSVVGDSVGNSPVGRSPRVGLWRTRRWQGQTGTDEKISR